MNHDVSGFEEIFSTFDINSVKLEQARIFQYINHVHRLKLKFDLESCKIFIKEQFSKYGIGSIQQPYFFTIHTFSVIDCVSLLLKSKIGTLYGSCYVDSEEGFYLDTVESNNFHLWAEPINQILLWDCPGYNGRRIYTSISNTINALSDLEDTYCDYLNHDDVCSLWDYYVGHSLKQLKWVGLQFDEEWQSDILFIFDPSEQSLMYKIKDFLKEAGYPTFDIT